MASNFNKKKWEKCQNNNIYCKVHILSFLDFNLRVNVQIHTQVKNSQTVFVKYLDKQGCGRSRAGCGLILIRWVMEQEICKLSKDNFEIGKNCH